MDEVRQRRRTLEEVAKSIRALSTNFSGVPDQLYEGYIFDLDGTIYLGDELLPGARRLVLKLRELGKRVVFLSNNPTKDPKMYAEKLTGMGIETPPSEIINTVVSMTWWLSQNHPDAAVFPHRRGATKARFKGGRNQDVRKDRGDRPRRR